MSVIKQAIAIIEHDEVMQCDCPKCIEDRWAFELAIQALREKAERENPKPLTWKEIKAFESMREVFLKELKTDLRHRLNCYAIRNDDGFILDTDNGLGYFKLLKEEYGKLYVAYRYKPEEDT